MNCLSSLLAKFRQRSPIIYYTQGGEKERNYNPSQKNPVHNFVTNLTSIFIPCSHCMPRSPVWLLCNLPWWWRQHVPLKHRSTIILHGSTSQKTNLNFILAAVRTWNFSCLVARRAVLTDEHFQCPECCYQSLSRCLIRYFLVRTA
jgi:hypothetical protein